MKFSLTKKRICLILVVICISFGYYGIISIIQKNERTMTTNALPITNKTVIIDAGHGKPDEGASGFNGTTEEVINLQLALKLQKLIEQSGGKVILTRSDENGIYSNDANSIRNKKVSDMKKRVEIGNNSDANIFVSIHLNKFPASESYKGWQVFYQTNNSKSQNLASIIQENLNKNSEKQNNRKIMKISNVYIMDKLELPTVIVECGFLSNREECDALTDETYQNKIVWGIYLGIQHYFLEEVTNGE